MKSLKVIALLLLMLPTLAGAQKKAKKPIIPAVFGQARYVFVQAVDGEEFNPNIDPADRLAIADVRDAMQAWGRYTITPEREHADLVFVVRKGRLAEGRGSVGISEPQGPQAGQQGAQFPNRHGAPATDVGVGGEAGPPDDVLQVCQLTPDGKLSGPLWIHSFAGGLDAPRLVLFAQFKEAVEKAYPNPPPKPPSKP
jgi:hypothetical protein